MSSTDRMGFALDLRTPADFEASAAFARSWRNSLTISLESSRLSFAGSILRNWSILDWVSALFIRHLLVKYVDHGLVLPSLVVGIQINLDQPQ